MFKISFLLFIIIICIQGCGGSGGGDDTKPPPTTINPPPVNPGPRPVVMPMPTPDPNEPCAIRNDIRIKGECLGYEKALAKRYEGEYTFPCGSDNVSSDPGSIRVPIEGRDCAFARVPGLSQLFEIVEEKRARGDAILSRHYHLDSFNDANPTSHGIRSEKLVEFLGAKDFFARRDNITYGESFVLKGIFSSGSEATLGCSQTSRYTCSNYYNSPGLFVLGTGNLTSGEDIMMQNQTTEENFQNLLDNGINVLLVAGLELNGIEIINNLDGSHIVFTDGELPLDELPDFTEPSYNHEFSLAHASQWCSEVAKNNCVVSTWDTIYDYKSSEGDRFAGTSNAHLYPAVVLTYVMYIWPNLTSEQILEIVRANAIDIGEPGPDAVYGLGIFSVQGLFTPAGDLIDPTTSLVVSSGSLVLPIQDSLSITGYDTYNRDFTVRTESFAFNPYVTEQKNIRGLYPYVSNDQQGIKGIMYQNDILSLSMRIEENGFLGGYGTGSYELGNTTWYSVGLSKRLNNFDMSVSFNHGDMSSQSSSLVNDIKGTYGLFNIGYTYVQNNVQLSLNANYRTSVLVDVTIQQNNFNSRVADDYSLNSKLTVRFN